MNKKIILATLTLILIIGCLGGSEKRPHAPAEATIEYGFGLKITDFSPDYDEIYSRDKFGLNLEVQNVGHDEASNIVVELSRYGDLSIPEEDLIQGGKSVLSPPDEANNVPGDERLFTWRVTAQHKTSTTDYDISAKVKYLYSSESTRDYTILSRERMLERKEQGIEATPAVPTTTTGPVEVKLSEQPTEVVLDFEGTRSFPIRIDLTDLGSGIVLSEDKYDTCTREIGCVDDVHLYIQAEPQIFQSIDCTREFRADISGEGEAPDYHLYNDPEAGYYAYLTNKDTPAGEDQIKINTRGQYEVIFDGVQLINKAGIISCFLTVDADTKNKPYFEQTYFVRALANYRYQIEERAKVTILGEGTVE